jgi:hypothetical protein
LEKSVCAPASRTKDSRVRGAVRTERTSDASEII